MGGARLGVLPEFHVPPCALHNVMGGARLAAAPSDDCVAQSRCHAKPNIDIACEAEFLCTTGTSWHSSAGERRFNAAGGSKSKAVKPDRGHGNASLAA